MKNPALASCLAPLPYVANTTANWTAVGGLTGFGNAARSPSVRSSLQSDLPWVPTTPQRSLLRRQPQDGNCVIVGKRHESDYRGRAQPDQYQHGAVKPQLLASVPYKDRAEYRASEYRKQELRDQLRFIEGVRRERTPKCGERGQLGGAQYEEDDHSQRERN